MEQLKILHQRDDEYLMICAKGVEVEVRGQTANGTTHLIYVLAVLNDLVQQLTSKLEEASAQAELSTSETTLH